MSKCGNGDLFSIFVSFIGLHGNIQKVQKISDLRTLYHRNTPQIGPVSTPPSGTKKKALDKAVFENESEVNNLTNLLVTKMNIPLEPNSYGKERKGSRLSLVNHPS